MTSIIPPNLIDKLISANAAYSKGLPFMTDTEYDKLWQEIHTIDPTESSLYHTGYDPTLPYNKLKHKHQIFGTQKAFNIEDLKPFFQRFGDEPLWIEPKYDGCAAVFYAGEVKDKLILEGDGIMGADVSHHLPYIACPYTIPQHMCSVELLIHKDAWKESYGANPRNTVAGWLNSKDITSHNNIISAISHHHGPLKEPYIYDGDYDKLLELLLQCHQAWSKLYPIDGLMLKPQSEKRRIVAGNNGTVSNWSIAWKPPIQTAEARVTGVEWNVSRNGRVIPTVVYEPVELCGTINTRATGNNAEWINTKGIGKGSTIIIGKAGEIIPKILSTKGTWYEDSIPIYCPVCHEILKSMGKDLICQGSNCIAQLISSLSYFYSDKGMDVKSLGAARISELLYDEELRVLLSEKPWALLDPEYYVITEKIKKIIGIKLTAQYINSLFDIHEHKSPIHFIAALGLPKLAYRTATKLYNWVKYNKVLKSVSREAIKSFGLGYSKFLSAEVEMTHFKFASVTPPADITYCITGKLSTTRNEFVNLLAAKGWQFVNQVSKSTNYLIIGDSPGRTKTTAAKQYEIVTLTEEEIFNKLYM